MSKYLEDAQGNIISNPINETNTKYPFTPKNESNVKEASDHPIDYQYMYNHDEPVSDIDTDAFSGYRNKTEELRKKTESTYEALESCLVPAEIPGMSFQPYEYRTTKNNDGDEITKKTKSMTYFFQDHASIIGTDAKEFVFRTNKVKFVDDRHRRLIYDREIHIMSLKEDEDNKVKFADVIRRTFYTYYKGGIPNDYFCEVRDTSGVRYTNIDLLLTRILEANMRKKDNERLVLLNDDGEEVEATTIDDFKNYVMQSGQDINTTVPSTVYNLYNLGWIHASMIFLNGLAIEWTKAIISVDNIDTFVIISGLRSTLADYIDDDKEITMDYIHIPFKCIYVVGAEVLRNTPYEQFINNTIYDTPIFVFDKRYGTMIYPSRHYRSVKGWGYYDRVICVDKNIKFDEFYLNDINKEFYLPDIAIQYNQSFRSFCNNDYRCKLKQFNFLGFEYNKDVSEYFKDKGISSTNLLTLKNNDYTVTWHPFNILDIRFKRLYNNRRMMKVFYNTKVLYDQDNILRIRNHGKLADEYEIYRQDITANIEIYLKELYLLAKKDIGTYIATEGFTEGYRYHYVSPYECFLLYNALQTLLGGTKVSFDDFRNINVINNKIHKKDSGDDDGGGGSGGGGDSSDSFDYTYPNYVYDDPDAEDYTVDRPQTSDDDEQQEDTEHCIGYMNGGFIIYDEDHNFFDTIVKEHDVYDEEGNVLSHIREFWQSIIDLDSDNKNLLDFLIPIDDVRNLEDRTPTNNNAFYSYQGDNRGSVIPYTRFIGAYGLTTEYDDVQYDYLKLRFEMSYLNNMEEGATPVDEYIYYFDTDEFNQTNEYPVVNNYTKRYTANLLNTLAYNIFKSDPHKVLESIVKLNYSADYIYPKDLISYLYRDSTITTMTTKPPTTDYNYQKDQRYFYNYGTYLDDGTPRKLVSEWGLRRNLPEMFYWALDKDKYTIDSMHLLDEVFDFTYGFDKSYEENLKHGVNYIIGYDADKLEQSIKRSIVSLSRTGKEIKAYKAVHPAEYYCTIESYKRITFTNNSSIIAAGSTSDYIVPINLERLYINIASDGTITYSYEDSEGLHKNADVVQLRYIGQTNPSITINNSQKYIECDKGRVTYDHAKFNVSTHLVEYYDANDNLLVTVQADKVSSSEQLSMSRWNISRQDNYVMIFKNRELYDKYNTIEYNDIAFMVDMPDSEIEDDDVFEFVFFLNANNTVIEKQCKTNDDLKISVPDAYYSKSSNGIRTDKNGTEMDKGLYTSITGTTEFEKAVSSNTSVIDAENAQLLVNIMPKTDDDKYKVFNNKNTTYELSYKMYSYEATTDNSGDEQRFIHTLKEDKKVNGLYRVTKQGGGEYFLEFDGKVPERSSDESISDDGNSHISPGSSGSGLATGESQKPDDYQDANYETDRTIEVPCTLYLSSKRQFRYKHIEIEQAHSAGYIYKLNNDTADNSDIDQFKYCILNSHLMVFKNGLLLPPTYYYLHSIVNTPINDVGIVFNVALEAGDKIDVFYVTNGLRHLETAWYPKREDQTEQERYVKNGLILLNSHNNEYRVMGEQMYTDSGRYNWRTNYIKLRSPLYGASSKHSAFIFLNGKKVRLDELEDISDTIIAINTDYARDREDMNAIRLEVINHLDTQDIIEQLYINDGLNHDDSIAQGQFSNTTKPDAYKDTRRIKSFSLTDLEAYAKRTLLDDILNDLSNENLNKLFYKYNTAEGPMTPYIDTAMNEPDFINPTEIIESIIDEYYFEEDGDKFIWHTEHGTDGFSNTVFYIGDSDSVKVPVTWSDEEVKALYGTTFNRNKTIRKVVIPEGVTSIE